MAPVELVEMVKTCDLLREAAKYASQIPGYLRQSVEQVSETANVRILPLDAVRGVAAAVVVLYHSSHYLGGWTPRFGYLSVDLFFIISGFLLANRNDHRFSHGMRASEFLMRRIVRLWPLLILGWMLGMINLAIYPVVELPLSKFLFTAALNLFALPSPFLRHGNSGRFGINGPLWSLFLEFWLANAFYAFFWRYLQGGKLCAIIGLNAAALIVTEKLFHNLNVGMEPANEFAGIPRTLFSFLMGVALARLHGNRSCVPTIPSATCLIISVTLLTMPISGWVGEIYELCTIFLFLPLLVLCAASSRETFGQLSMFLGNVSFAAYAIHYPLLQVFAVNIANSPDSNSKVLQCSFLVAIGLIASAVAWGDKRIQTALLARCFRSKHPRLSTKSR